MAQMVQFKDFRLVTVIMKQKICKSYFMQSGIILFLLKYVKETEIAVMGTGVAVTNDVIFSNLKPAVAVQKNSRQQVLHQHYICTGFLSRNKTSLDL